MRLISMATRDELVAAVAGHYALGNREEQSRAAWLYQFTAIDDCSRYLVVGLARRAIAAAMVVFLD